MIIRKFNRLESAQKVHANRVLLFFNLFSMSLRNTCMLLNLNNFKILYYYNTAQNLQDKMIERASRIIHYKIILYRSLCSCLLNCHGVL